MRPMPNCSPLPASATCVEPALDHGADALRLIREIARQPGLDTRAARHLVDATSARHWLASGVPVADVLTMLEVRHRFELSPQAARVHAMDVVCAVRQAAVDNAKYEPIRNHKEPRHAAA